MAKELFGQFLIRRDKVRQEDIEEALVLQEILSDSLGAADTRIRAPVPPHR